MKINNITIPRVTWDNFPGIPKAGSKWKAYTIWNINYNVKNTHMIDRKYYLEVDVRCYLSKKSWYIKDS